MKVQMTVGEAERLLHAHHRMRHLAEVLELVSDDLLFLIPTGGDEMRKLNGEAVESALKNQLIIPRNKARLIVLLCVMNTVAFMTMLAVRILG